MPLLAGIAIGITIGYLSFNTFRVNVYGLTEDEKKIVNTIESDLKNTEKEIAEATEEDRKYGKSLIKTLVKLRISILNTTADLLRQRLYGIRLGSKENITINSSKPDNNLADLLEKTIERQNLTIEEAKSDADSYSGLVGALHSSRLATEQQTLSVLRLQYYVAKYGLSFLSTADTTDSSLNTAVNDSTKEAADSLQKKTEQETKDINMCKKFASFAMVVMKKRQDEVPMYKLLEIARDNQEKDAVRLLEMIVEQAYSEHAMRNQENRERQQNEFSNKIFRQCYNGN